MNVLLIGSGGREHALAWKISQSSLLSKLYTLPGNFGTSDIGINLPGNPLDISYVVKNAQLMNIDLVVVGPEAPLASGIADALIDADILVYGPSKLAAQIEADKAFAKDFMVRHQIPTAVYRNFSNFHESLDFFKHLTANNDQLPVIKVSGLAGGKGVILPDSISQSETTLRQILVERSFGDAGAEVVIEERLFGREVTVMAFTDGKSVVPMLPSQDHKRLLDNDQGPNTGGMGVFAPSPFAPSELVDWVVANVIQPAVEGLHFESKPFTGTIYAGIILTNDGPKTLEFNCRFGDPETQVVLPLLDSDILEIFLACSKGYLDKLADSIRWKDASTVCVVLASAGYPEKYNKGIPIDGLDNLPEEVVAFHAGTDGIDGRVITNGGRVLGITGIANSISNARSLAYSGVNNINFKGMQYRKDIAKGF
jgi:phosphoribosylamine--glycine ligase